MCPEREKSLLSFYSIWLLTACRADARCSAWGPAMFRGPCVDRPLVWELECQQWRHNCNALKSRAAEREHDHYCNLYSITFPYTPARSLTLLLQPVHHQRNGWSSQMATTCMTPILWRRCWRRLVAMMWRPLTSTQDTRDRQVHGGHPAWPPLPLLLLDAIFFWASSMASKFHRQHHFTHGTPGLLLPLAFPLDQPTHTLLCLPCPAAAPPCTRFAASKDGSLPNCKSNELRFCQVDLAAVAWRWKRMIEENRR